MYKPKFKPNMGIRSNFNMGVDTIKLLKLAEDISDFKENTSKEVAKTLETVNETAKETKENIVDIKKLSATMESRFEEMTNELVSMLKEIKSQGLKGDKGEDANEEAIAQRVMEKFPTKEEIIEEINPTKLAEQASGMLKPTPASLKIITQNLDGNEIVPKLNQAKNIDDLKLSMNNITDWPKKWNDVKAEISRNKGYLHGGGFNNISSSGTVVSTGLDTLNFTGATVTQSGRTVTVAVTGGGFTPLTLISGDIDDVNTTFVFSGTPSGVIINGSTYFAGQTSGSTIMWTNSGATVTTANPVGAGGSIGAFA